MADMKYEVRSMKLESLILEIEQGKLGLPTIQRPFVWPNTKVRDLFDSMLRQYPIGFIMLWNTPLSFDTRNVRHMGEDSKDYTVPHNMLIDGQQRLTALYAVMRGIEVVDSKFKKRKIIISFNSITREFRVGDNATRWGSEWIYDIGEVFRLKGSSRRYINNIINQVREGRKKEGLSLDDTEVEQIDQNVSDLIALKSYIIPALEINAETDAEAIAEIFVRVNSGGEKLQENDFIMTLVAHHWLEGRKKIEDFCESAAWPGGAAYNRFIIPMPSHIVRVAMGYGFKRGSLRYAHMLLQGRDLEKEVTSEETRIRNFNVFKDVVDRVIDTRVWHDFLKCIELAGFINDRLISSKNAVMFTYALYLLGRFDYKMKEDVLRQLMARWFFMAHVSGYYTDSAESTMERDLADMRNLDADADRFIALLNSKIAAVFTRDYFDVTLPTGNGGLVSSSALSPAWLGYCAALNILDAKCLFSNLRTKSLLEKSSGSSRSSLERHHLFPKAYLARRSISEHRAMNQVANFALIEKHVNQEISDNDPSEYMTVQSAKLREEEREMMYFWHALPENWEHMDYMDFLQQRRVLMAKVIQRGFAVLSGEWL